MARDNPRGFVEHRHLGGATHPSTRKYRVDAANAPHPLYPGDSVVSVSGQTVVRTPATATAGCLNRS